MLHINFFKTLTPTKGLKIMIKRDVTLILVFIYFIFTSQIVFADAQGVNAAKAVVENFQTQLTDVMKNGKNMNYTQRYDKLKGIVTSSHDLTKIARIVVGKEWEKLTEEQQKKLVDVFAQLSIASYAHNFKDYSGEEFDITSVEETNRGGVVVYAKLKIPGDKDVKFEYNLKETDNKWRIINIVANGVSDLALKRSEYTSILQREGFDALIAKINEKIEAYSKQK
jgi:phospholipid transport system substrate-binding protein